MNASPRHPQAAETAGVNPRQLEEIEITYMTIMKQEGLWAALNYYLHGHSLTHGSVTGSEAQLQHPDCLLGDEAPGWSFTDDIPITRRSLSSMVKNMIWEDLALPVWFECCYENL